MSYVSLQLICLTKTSPDITRPKYSPSWQKAYLATVQYFTRIRWDAHETKWREE